MCYNVIANAAADTGSECFSMLNYNTHKVVFKTRECLFGRDSYFCKVDRHQTSALACMHAS